MHVRSKFPARNFTVSLDLEAKRLELNGRDLRQVRSRREFRGGTFLVEGAMTFAAFDLTPDAATLTVS